MSYQPIQDSQPRRTVQPMYGEFPVNVVCPYCQARTMTCTILEEGNLTYFAASALCLMG